MTWEGKKLACYKHHILLHEMYFYLIEVLIDGAVFNYYAYSYQVENTEGRSPHPDEIQSCANGVAFFFAIS